CGPTTSTLSRPFRSPLSSRPSEPRQTEDTQKTGCVPVGQVKLVLISCPQLSHSPCRTPAGPHPCVVPHDRKRPNGLTCPDHPAYLPQWWRPLPAPTFARTFGRAGRQTHSLSKEYSGSSK